MVSNDGFSAPRRRMRYSSSAASRCSLMPGRTRATASSKARELVSTDLRMRAISSAVFTMRNSSIQPGAGASDALMGRRAFNASKRSHVMRAGSYPTRFKPSRAMAAETSTTSAPLQIFSFAMVSWAA